MERAIISGIAFSCDEAKITVLGVPERPVSLMRFSGLWLTRILMSILSFKTSVTME